MEKQNDFLVILPPNFQTFAKDDILLGSFDLLRKEIFLVRAVHKECEPFTWSGLSEIGCVALVPLSSGFCCLQNDELEKSDRHFKFFYDGIEIKQRECKSQREFNDLFYTKHFLFYFCDSLTLSESALISENLKKDISFIVPGLDRIISSTKNYSKEAPLDPNELRPRKYMNNNITIPIVDVHVITGSLSNINHKGSQITLNKSDEPVKLKEIQLKFATAILDQINESLSLFLSYPLSHKTKVLHFCPEDKQIITAIYPSLDNSDDSLTSLRTRYHHHYYLPQKPFFRVVQAIEFSANDNYSHISTSTPSSSSFSSSASSSSSSSISFSFAASGGESKITSSRLKNVHLALPQKENGSVHLVQGTYDYYHYMQDSFNDSGWGCAYRSCQTIESWYYNEGLSRKPIQTHREIQKTIFTCGQRKKGFIGSTEWIGSLEIQTVLSSYLNVDSKILHISKGGDILKHTQTIKDHFDNHGTPVMIGGGQLAYTLLGIFTSNNSKTLFLILDPHYTGKDDLKTIVGKGWCGWKERESIFLDNHFYNLCFPQVSNAI